MKALTACGVPIDFIISGIYYTFIAFADRRPRSFAYCAEVVKERVRDERYAAFYVLFSRRLMNW
ncbi:hypothetical protein GCM10025858_39170 [Alicyclobacillus sacchari]|uniref:hypothetical protein n=1 Tax=Alicyclobacillus sacchari TaxID=392010 RepID=UPI001FBA6A55|nr:hypothetical protein [Alicyclobacillus sacchari]GMA59271.1 hypothetical protein GCM10025858_37740 [Alicyclobacillus sacchari]GMA59414.1 hypothetical protein GCM10025858_39170 [Alicyclobacillus sacchari]